MEEARQQYIEDFGLLFEEFGGGRMVGRILGLLMVADAPELSAEEIADTLKVSRGSISQSTRILIQLGMVRRTSRPGERRDYFQLRPDAWTEATRRRGHEIERLIAIFERGARLTAGGDPRQRRQLEESLVFMQFWKQTLADMFPAWERERERRFGDTGNRNP
ncbi:MAG TPA: MarR family transcriptional regulator [Thermomicrobiales bacterium]|nr:MarR family transcriptional regulator [Thermomicrobiales bacterium]